MGFQVFSKGLSVVQGFKHSKDVRGIPGGFSGVHGIFEDYQMISVGFLRL